MPTDGDIELASLEQGIISYLQHNPNAADTIEGVAKWWLNEQYYQYRLDLVEKALEHLSTQGLVRRDTTVDGRVIYSIAKATNL